MYESLPSSLPVNDFQQRVIDEFRANGGIVGGPFQGSSLLLLTTVGARTRRRHTTPLGYAGVDGKRVVVASAGGADRNPAWLHNLRAHPVVRVEAGSETYAATATVLSGAVRDHCWDQIVGQHAGYAAYQRMTARLIPLVEIHPLPLPPRQAAGRVRGMGDFIHEVHQWMSTELDLVIAKVDAIIATADTAEPMTVQPGTLHAQLLERCVTFCGALERHHLGEDFGAFPMVAEAFPALAQTLEQLSAEHVVVAEINATIRELLEGYTPGASDPRLLRTQLHGLHVRLREHFAYEEHTILDALNAVADAPPSARSDS